MATTNKRENQIVLSLNRKSLTIAMEWYDDEKKSLIDIILARMTSAGWDDSKMELRADGSVRISWIYADEHYNWMEEAFEYLQEKIGTIE